MPFSRRRFLEVMGAAGVTIPAGNWLSRQMEAYAQERLTFADRRGPGLTTFSQSVCRECANHCSISVRKVDGLPVGVRGTAADPDTRGALCVAGSSHMQALYDPDRLDSPRVRNDAGADSRAAEWGEAIDLLRNKLEPLAASGDGNRIAVVDGRTPSLGTRLLAAWTHSIPGALYIPFRVEHAIDRLARRVLRGHPGGRLSIDLAKSGAVLLVGAEILEVDGSPVFQMRTHAERREDPRQGSAPTIYLGHRQGPTAAKADLYVECSPGQERDILLAFAESLSRTHPQRDRILPEYAQWIPEARDNLEFARKYSLESVGSRYGLYTADLEATLRALVEFPPAVILPGPGLVRRDGGRADTIAALALNLWTNGFREEGGYAWVRDPLEEIASSVGLETPSSEEDSGFGEMLQPLLEIRRSPVDVLICVGANLVHEMPGRDQIARALSHVPFVAAFSTHEDDTSRIAHVTYPLLLDIESWDIPSCAWGAPNAGIRVQRPAVVPAVDARSAEDVILGLAADGVAGPSFQAQAGNFEGVVAAAVDALVATGRGRLHRAEDAPALAESDPGMARRSLLTGDASWVDSSKTLPPVEDASPRIEEAGPPALDRAPDQLWLMPFDAPAIQCGRVLNRPMMMELSGLWHGLSWESWVEIHPDDAKRTGVSTGDLVHLRGPRAEITLRAVVTRSVMVGVAAVPVGFGHEWMGRVARGRGVSPLRLGHTVVDAETGAPAWGPIPVFLDKA